MRMSSQEVVCFVNGQRTSLKEVEGKVICSRLLVTRVASLSMSFSRRQTKQAFVTINVVSLHETKLKIKTTD